MSLFSEIDYDVTEPEFLYPVWGFTAGIFRFIAFSNLGGRGI